MIQFDEYRLKAQALLPALGELEKALHLDAARAEIDELQQKSTEDGFWNDLATSQKVMSRIINEVKGVNRVMFDLTSKPPGTIELE